MIVHKMVQNYPSVQDNVDVLHTLQKAKKYVFNGHFAFPSIQTVHVFMMIHFVSGSNIRMEFVS